MRVVLDTNILVSALGFGGKIARIWDLAESKHFDLFTSSFILEELERNLIKKADLSSQFTKLLVDEVKNLATVVEPSIRISVIKGKDSDNRILECAVVAKADILVTGDIKHIRCLGTFQGIEILTPREFLDMYFPTT